MTDSINACPFAAARNGFAAKSLASEAPPAAIEQNLDKSQTSGPGVFFHLTPKLLGSSIPALDGIRAIAVFLVIFYHLGLERGLPVFPGSLGVLAFFVLSGFLITWLLLKEEEKYGSISLKGFYRRRALRIFPAFYVYWIVEILARLAGGGQVPWPQALSAFFYVSNYQNAIYRPQPEYMMQTWSLAVEEQFYLVWPLCFVLFSKKKKTLMTGLSVFILGVWFHRLHLWLAGHAKDYISYAFDTRVDALLVGCLLALLIKQNLGIRVLETLCRPAWAPACTCSLIAFSTYCGQSPSAASQGYRLTAGLAIEPWLIALLICQLIVHSTTVPWNWLNSRTSMYLGRISYPLYLYHGLGVAIAIRVSGSHNYLCVTATVILAIIMAACSYHFVEKPFIALKNKIPQPRQPVKISRPQPEIGGALS